MHGTKTETLAKLKRQVSSHSVTLGPLEWGKKLNASAIHCLFLQLADNAAN
jgi:hypothetical protein